MTKDKPGPTCSICKHKKKDEINERLLNRPTSCESIQEISDNFSISYQSLWRHANNCIADKLSKSKDLAKGVSGESLTCQLKTIRGTIKDCLLACVKSDDLRTAHLFANDTLKQIELEAKIEGQIHDQQVNVQLNQNTQINVLQAPEWVEMRSTIMKALEPYEKARVAVVLALSQPGRYNRRSAKTEP